MNYKITQEQLTSLINHVAKKTITEVWAPILDLLNGLEKIEEPKKEIKKEIKKEEKKKAKAEK